MRQGRGEGAHAQAEWRPRSANAWTELEWNLARQLMPKLLSLWRCSAASLSATAGQGGTLAGEHEKTDLRRSAASFGMRLFLQAYGRRRLPGRSGLPDSQLLRRRNGQIWQGERPSSSDASWLLEQRVGTVVNLEVYLDDSRAFERASAPQRELVVEYYHVPDFEPVHLFNWSLLDNHVAHFLAIVAAAPKPVYVHCLDGIDRSNVLIASYRVLVEGVNPEDAIREIARFDSPWLHVDAKYLRGLNERRAAILEKTSKWQAHLAPGAKIECSQGRCTYSTAGQLRARASS